MTLYQLFLSNTNPYIFTGFTTALMKTYLVADLENKEKLNAAFPDYFIEKNY